MKRNNGITLIALVITIIILIILAGISISLLMGEDGLITKAKQGAQNYQNATLEEQEMLNNFYGDFATEIASTGSGDAAASLIAFKRTIAQAITTAGVATSENDSAETMATNIGNMYNLGRTQGISDVTSNPAGYGLYTEQQYNDAVSSASVSNFPSIYNSSNNELVYITVPALSCQVNGTSTTSGVYTVKSKMTCSLTLTASGVTSYSNSASVYINGSAYKSVTSAEGQASNSTSFTYTFNPGDQIYVRAYRTGSNQNIVATLTFNSIVAAE